MLPKLQKIITTDFPFLQEKKLLLAVSGGVDSIVMIRLFHKLNYQLAVAHCNFGLRGAESDGDEAFVMETCQALDIPLFTTRFDTTGYAEQHKLSIQLAARQLRYDWFHTLLENEGYDYLLTAHHADDAIETFLINLTRGTGLEGLTGIPKQNDKIIRPLLAFSRKEIEEYAREHQISWREDSSNASDKYQRNRLRHQLVPVLKELNPNFLNSFQETLQHLQQAETLMKDAAAQMYKLIVTEKEEQKLISIEKLKLLSDYNAYLYQWLKPFGFTAWNDIYDLVEAQSGKQVFSAGYRLLKDREFLILEKQKKTENRTYEIVENQEIKPGDFSIIMASVTNVTDNEDSRIIFVDKDKLKLPLVLRKWEEGDYFYPSGMNGRKKLSKYFKDEKFSLIDKEKCWLLCSDNQIVWVVGKRSDRRFKVEPITKTIIKIELRLW